MQPLWGDTTNPSDFGALRVLREMEGQTEMSNNSRFPFKSQIQSMPSEHQYVIRNLWNVMSDVQDSIPLLKAQIDAKTTTSTTASSTSSTTSSASQTVVNDAGSVTGGVVNDQRGVTSYTIQQSDNASLVLLSDASPISVTLNSSLTTPYYTTISNEGVGTVTLTPSTGTINSVSSITILGGGFATLFLDGTNWWADSPGVVAGGVTQIIAGTNVTITPTGGTGTVTINSTGGGGGTITGVTAGTGLTGGGTSGTVTMALDTPVSVANGGTGTSTPSLVAGSNVTITGTWPDQTISATGGGGGYPTVITSALSTTSYTGSYSWTSPSLVNGAAYRLSVYASAMVAAGNTGAVTGVFSFTDFTGETVSGIPLVAISITNTSSTPMVGRNSGTYTFAFSNALSSTITVSFASTETITYFPEVIVLERLA